jgi:hypothetical protein
METDISGELRAAYLDAVRAELERLGVSSRTVERRGGAVALRVLSPVDHRLSEELTYAEVVADPLACPLLFSWGERVPVRDPRRVAEVLNRTAGLTAIGECGAPGA